jgi:thiamine-monophosphate kinase
MKVSELGEFGLIDLLAKMTRGKQSPTEHQLIIGIGDDAAAWHGDSSVQLATADFLVQDVHFSLDTTSWKELGWKALAVTLSDIAAMGGVPRYALISLALPDTTELEDVTDLYNGMIELAQQFDVAIAGGDTSQASMVAISITVLGSTKSQDKLVLTRSAARAGDKVAVTGDLGAAAAGLEMLSKQIHFNPEATASLRAALLHPYPRIKEGQLLVEQGVKAAIDISDGLISDLNHICKSSQVSARIEADQVPVNPVVRTSFGKKALELALSGGEDYELLFTASPQVIDRIKELASCPITIIGEITADKASKVILFDSKGNHFSPHKSGWEHFSG